MFQHRSEIEFKLNCDKCGEFARYALIKLSEELAGTVRCDQCQRQEARAEARNEASRKRQFEAAQTAWPWRT